MDTGSCGESAEGSFLAAPAMAWFWDRYLPDKSQHDAILVSPVGATADDLAGLPPALVINGQVDRLHDEGEAYAANLRAAGVPVTTTHYSGIIHHFEMLRPRCGERGPGFR